MRIHFNKDAAPYVRRRQWHASQTFVERRDGVELHLRACVDGMRGREIQNLVMRFGAAAEILEPASLREAIRSEHEAALKKYMHDDTPPSSRRATVTEGGDLNPHT